MVPRGSQTRTGRARPGRLCLALGALASLAACAAAAPLGRVVWTERRGAQFTPYTQLFAPPDAPRLVQDGPIKVDQDHMIIVTENGLHGAAGTTDLSKTGTLDATSPRAEMSYMHPALDYTGRRLLFTGGATWGPDLTGSDAGDVAGGTAIYYGMDESDRQVSAPPGGGGGFDAYPAMDTNGRYLYFSRFFYQPDGPVTRPGWYLMRVERKLAEQTERGREEFLRENGSGDPIAGSQPTLDSQGRYLFFVRRDPDGIGSDIWALPLVPDVGSLPAEPLVQGEGEGFSMPAPGADRDAWVEWSRFKGKARIQRPSVSPDGRYIAYACDRDGDWDLYTMEVDLRADPPTARDEKRVLADSDRDQTDESWPSVSGDGRYIAFQTNRDNGAPSKSAQGVSQVRWVEVSDDREPASDSTAIRAPEGEDQLWPVWDQDEDPPHLLIVLNTSDGSVPTRIEFLDVEPDDLPATVDDPATDRAEFSMYMPDYYESAPPPGEGTGFDPIHFGFRGGDKKPVTLRYALDSGPSDTGFNPFTRGEDRRGHGLHVLLSKRRDDLGLHRAMDPATLSGDDFDAGRTGPGEPGAIVNDEFDGMYLFENQRLGISVYARDNRWLRVGPTDAERSLYLDEDGNFDLAYEGRVIEPKDDRSIADAPARPPYLQKRDPEEVMGSEKFPGICWWIEEGPRGETDESNLEEPRHVNAPYVIFRFANYPPEKYADDASRNKDLYLRVVARDLMGNATDVRIPLHIRGKDFQFNTVQSGTKRRDD